jgi:CRISPR-associated protein Cas1
LTLSGTITERPWIPRTPAKDVAAHSALRDAADSLARTGEWTCQVSSIDQVRGCEGEAAQMYFGSVPELIGGEQGAFEFRGRSRRPPLGNVNALLSFTPGI